MVELESNSFYSSGLLHTLLMSLANLKSKIQYYVHAQIVAGLSLSTGLNKNINKHGVSIETGNIQHNNPCSIGAVELLFTLRCEWTAQQRGGDYKEIS